MGKIYNGNTNYAEPSGILLAEVRENGYVYTYPNLPGGSQYGTIIGKVDFSTKRVYEGNKGINYYSRTDLVGCYDEYGYVYQGNDPYYLSGYSGSGFRSSACVGKIDYNGGVMKSEMSTTLHANCPDPYTRYADGAAVLLLILPMLEKIKKADPRPSGASPRYQYSADGKVIGEKPKPSYSSYSSGHVAPAIITREDGILYPLVKIRNFAGFALLTWAIIGVFSVLASTSSVYIYTINEKWDRFFSLATIYPIYAIYVNTKISFAKYGLRYHKKNKKWIPVFIPISAVAGVFYYKICRFVAGITVGLFAGKYKAIWTGINPYIPFLMGFILCFLYLWECEICDVKHDKNAYPLTEDHEESVRVADRAVIIVGFLMLLAYLKVVFF